MLRTVIRPENRNISIKLPQNYVGKQVEVIAFTIDEDSVAETQAADTLFTHYASEKSLAKDWLTKQEDEVWRDL